MAAIKTENSKTVLDGLTQRQRDVLDGLLQHKTSKEIARDLDISPHTVDQRIRFAKEKLGVYRRSDLATAYRELRGICEEPVYENLRIDPLAIPLSNEHEPEGALIQTERRARTERRAADTANIEANLVPTIFEGSAGGWTRTGAIFIIAAAAIFLCVGGLAMLDQLSRLVV